VLATADVVAVVIRLSLTVNVAENVEGGCRRTVTSNWQPATGNITLGHRHIACGNTITNFRSNFITSSSWCCCCDVAAVAVVVAVAFCLYPEMLSTLHGALVCAVSLGNITSISFAVFILLFSISFSPFCCSFWQSKYKWNYTLFTDNTHANSNNNNNSSNSNNNNVNKYDKQTNWK